MVKSNILECIGNTPLVGLNRIFPETKNQILAKLEGQNPSGSVKDRTALGMIRWAITQGLIKQNTTIIEPTSGNTGIALAMICARMNLKLILTMPENMSPERKNLLKLYGAELVLTPASLGMKGAIETALEIRKKKTDSIILNQFENPANPKIHENTTGPEIWEDTHGTINILVAGIGTGGTITGIGRYLKQKNPKIKIVGIEPYASPVITRGRTGLHTIQGIGAGFIPKILDLSLIDEIIPVKDEDAYTCMIELARKEGISAGPSSGAVLWAMKEIYKRNPKAKIVGIFPDGAIKYISLLNQKNL